MKQPQRPPRPPQLQLLQLQGILFAILVVFATVHHCQQCPNVTCQDSLKVKKVLTIAVLLPSAAIAKIETDPVTRDLVLNNRLDHVKLGVQVIADVNNTMQLGSYRNRLSRVLPGWQIKVITGDTECSSTSGPLEAFRLHCQAG